MVDVKDSKTIEVILYHGGTQVTGWQRPCRAAACLYCKSAAELTITYACVHRIYHLICTVRERRAL